MIDFLRRRWFLIVLLGLLLAGIAAPQTLAPLAGRVPRYWVIAVVLCATSLPLRTEVFAAAIQRPGPALLAVACNYLLLPFYAWAAGFTLGADLRLGLFVAVSAPCTLASAAVWTRLAGGNPATAIMVTVVTNLGCFVAAPTVLWLLAGQTVEGPSFAESARRLFVLIVVPLIVGQLLRLIPPVRRWADRSSWAPSVIGQAGILLIIFVGAVYCGQTLAGLGNGLMAFLGRLPWMVACVSLVHTAAWASAFRAAGALAMPRAEQIAVGFAGSQKTLTVALAVALEYGGLTILPVLAHHIAQLVIDTLIAERLRQRSPG